VRLMRTLREDCIDRRYQSRYYSTLYNITVLQPGRQKLRGLPWRRMGHEGLVDMESWRYILGWVPSYLLEILAEESMNQNASTLMRCKIYRLPGFCW
jgi:hypothetical protein